MSNEAINYAKALAAELNHLDERWDAANRTVQTLDREITTVRDKMVEVVKSLTEGRGADVILDMVGGDYIERNIKAAATDGRIVSIAFLNGSTANVNFMPIMLKRLTLTGSTLRPRSIEEKAALAAALEAKVWPLIEAGRVKPLIDKVFPLGDAAGAHALMEKSSHIGKIVLTT